MAIMNYIISDMRPLSTVESVAFRDMISKVAPHVEIVTRKTIGTQIDTKVSAMTANIISTLEKVEYASTTADIWTAHQRSYFGAVIFSLTISRIRTKIKGISLTRIRIRIKGFKRTRTGIRIKN